MNANPFRPTLSLQEKLRQVVEDLYPEIARRQVEVELDLPEPPIFDQGRAEALRQAISLLLADSILRAEMGEPLLITLVGDSAHWELEIADANLCDDDELSRMEWMNQWPPLQKALREFSGQMDLRRCAQGGWAVTLRGAVAQVRRAAG